MASRIKFVGTVPVDANQVEGSFREQFSFNPVATNTTVEIPLGFVDTDRPVLLLDSVSIIPSEDISKNGTNYVTFAVYNRGSDGTGTDVLATADTNAGSGVVAKLIRTALTIDATKRIKKGDLLTFASTKSGSGVALPGFLVEVKVKQ